MSKGEQDHSTPQAVVEAPPPVYPAMPQSTPVYPAMPQSTPYPGMQTNTLGGEYPMQQVHAPSGYSLPQQTGAVPLAGPTPGPVDPAMAAAIAGQQYRDQLFAQCALGRHERVTNYGICGIITAIVGATTPFTQYRDHMLRRDTPQLGHTGQMRALRHRTLVASHGVSSAQQAHIPSYTHCFHNTTTTITTL
ncbi:hypothetical protein CVT25_006847 [Psilocybe cyanescens]|uniref:Uncharacterized protein n=1 Tax=Psilocybe cyanescens TaxID=93625 RepID=A0A409X798_PSICY|nr:hypothetical protein CVT25_006847 [Psilocybe cyanescens]